MGLVGPGPPSFVIFDTLQEKGRRKKLINEEKKTLKIRQKIFEKWGRKSFKNKEEIHQNMKKRLQTRVMALATAAWSRERFHVNSIAESKLRKASRKTTSFGDFSLSEKIRHQAKLPKRHLKATNLAGLSGLWRLTSRPKDLWSKYHLIAAF